MWNKCIKIIIPLFGFLHLINGSHLQLSRPRPITAALRPVKFSAQIPASSNRRQSIVRDSDESLPSNYDYSSGFPDGFAQGLPSFDFNGPIPGGSGSSSGGPHSSPAHHLNKDQALAASNENLGFVHGPPQGFPNLEALGADFPNFGGGSSGEPQRYHSHSPYSSHRHPEEPHNAPSDETDERDDEYGPVGGRNTVGPLESGYRGSSHRDSSPHSSHHHRDSSPHGPYHRHQQSSPSYSPPHRHHSSGSPHYSRGSSGGSHSYDSPRNSLNSHNHHSNYHHSHSPHSSGASSKRPIVLKVSSLKQAHHELPAGPPVFYAPSPDKQPNTHSSSHFQEESDLGFVKVPSAFEQSTPNRYNRYRRSADSSTLPVGPVVSQDRRRKVEKPSSSKKQYTKSKRVKSESVTEKGEDMEADGSEQEAFWELSSPFILFDRYKKEEEDHTARQPHTTTQNLTFDTDGGEQRFFPSFPASSPYLGNLGNPFGGGPAGRPPLFPGPAANRAPSRYHPQFGPKYTAPAPNRGPSNVYSAESHDRYQDTNLLGSGNFEVVRGGTYYGDDDDGYHGGSYHHPHDDDDGYYHHNGHSSPQGYRAPGGDFFSNFRDFADINPPSRSFSHNHETLTEPRQLSSASNRTPKNILDKLESSSDTVPVHHAISRESDPMMATF